MPGELSAIFTACHRQAAQGIGRRRLVPAAQKHALFFLAISSDNRLLYSPRSNNAIVIAGDFRAGFYPLNPSSADSDNGYCLGARCCLQQSAMFYCSSSVFSAAFFAAPVVDVTGSLVSAACCLATALTIASR